MIDPSTIDSEHHAADAAAKAAIAGQPGQMLVELRAAGFLDAAAKTLRGKHPALDHDQVDASIAEGIDETYRRCRSAGQIRNFTAYIWKVAHHKCSARARVVARESSLEHTPPPQAPGSGIPESEAEDRESLREGLRVARSLIPRLGQENVVTVMTLLLEAVESGVFYVSAADISDATGLSENTVRQCLSRGRRRLRELARQQGFCVDASIEYTARSAEGDHA
ncbi:MAG: sigma-70 family RNA polymerase sigma factor [Planctomycetota bacterium]